MDAVDASLVVVVVVVVVRHDDDDVPLLPWGLDGATAGLKAETVHDKRAKTAIPLVKGDILEGMISMYWLATFTFLRTASATPRSDGCDVK